MEKVVSFGIGQGPTVILVAEPSGLAMSLIEKLLANFCRVNVYAINTNGWNYLSSHIKENKAFTTLSINESLEKSDYVFFISTLFSKIEYVNIGDLVDVEDIRIDKFVESSKHAKNFIAILPLVFEDGFCALAQLYTQRIPQSLDNFLITYLGNLYGPRMILNQRDVIAVLVKESVLPTKNLILNYGSDFLYPASINISVKVILRLVFSGNYFGKKICIAGKKIAVDDAIVQIQGILEKKSQISFVKNQNYLIGTWDKAVILKGLDSEKITETIKWYRDKNIDFYNESILPPLNYSEKRQPLVKSRKGSKTFNFNITTFKPLFDGLKFIFVATGKNISKKSFKFPNINLPSKPRQINQKTRITAFIISILVTVLILPLIELFLSLIFLLVGGHEIKSGDFKIAGYFFNAAKISSSFSAAQTSSYLKADIFEKKIEELQKYTLITEEISETGITSCHITQQATDLLSKLLSKQKLDQGEAGDLSLALGNLYNQTSFLEGEINEVNFLGIGRIRRYFDNFNFGKKRETLMAARLMVSHINELIGEKENKTYLILFQNNMELRPTGGFIGSFATVKFNNGVLFGIDVFDVYSADGQLKGHVEPPWQIKEYLGQATWYLRDSNWDPDFSVSAQRAEWFLDKEMDISVDGVIAVDLNVIADLVGILGPLNIKDYNQQINSKNFYEITQYESEKNFFPGSRAKANFISAVAEKLIAQINFLKKRGYYPLFSSINKNLDERHLQIFLHDTSLQKEISRLGWDGTVDRMVCTRKNCYYDWFGVVEANLGVNKANYFVERRATSTINVDEDNISHQLDVYLKSKANKALEVSGTYKAYLRIIAPAGSVFSEVEETTVGEKLSLKPFVEYIRGTVETGVFVEIKPGQEKKLSFRWVIPNNLDLKTNGEYGLFIRKQAGIENFQNSGRIELPKEIKIGSDTSGVLTVGGNVTYNTTLVRDNFIHLFW